MPYLHHFLLPARTWQLLFFCLLAGYSLYYAPFGINETDGGFLTGLAWQVLSGKMLYQEVIYVRPPLPVWLRVMEIKYLPETWAILGERWIFYGKIACYSWLGASVLTKGGSRWQLACLGFVVSAHCYPPMAWHTVDGILFAVFAAWLLVKDRPIATFISGMALAGSLLCKQSFYPLLPVFILFAAIKPAKSMQNAGMLMFGSLLTLGVFGWYLALDHRLDAFLQMTGGASSARQALEHGILDYFRITPELALPGLALLIPAFYGYYKQKNTRYSCYFWIIWLLALPLSFIAVTLWRQEHTVPFAASRAMFLIAVGYLCSNVWRSEFVRNGDFSARILSALQNRRSEWLLLLVSWSAAVSWGYNLPILFATPWVWAGMKITEKMTSGIFRSGWHHALALGYLLLLLATFRVGYSFIYRDGKRSDMHQPMGEIFTALQSVYSDDQTAEMYQELKLLASKYQVFAVMPAFPQAHFLTKSKPPLPLDWVVNRETNGHNELVERKMRENQPILFIQKSFWSKIQTDPELSLTREWVNSSVLLEETVHFKVISVYGER